MYLGTQLSVMQVTARMWNLSVLDEESKSNGAGNYKYSE